MDGTDGDRHRTRDDRAREPDAFAGAMVATRALSAGESLCVQGDPARNWWLVSSGTGDVLVDGCLVGRVEAGQSVGELGVMEDRPRSASVVASSIMVVHELDGSRFVDTVTSSPGAGVALLEGLARSIRITDLISARWSDPVVAHHHAAAKNPLPGSARTPLWPPPCQRTLPSSSV